MEWLFELMKITYYRKTLWARRKIFEGSCCVIEELQSDDKEKERDEWKIEMEHVFVDNV
jgi:hypothetical protein